VRHGPLRRQAAMKAGKRVIAAARATRRWWSTRPPTSMRPRQPSSKEPASITTCCALARRSLRRGLRHGPLHAAMRKAGAVELDAPAIERLSQAAFTFDGQGKGCGAHTSRRTWSARTPPCSPTPPACACRPHRAALRRNERGARVRAGGADDALLADRARPRRRRRHRRALRAEHGYRHTALIHSRDVATVTKMARAMNTTLFVHNAACTAALGLGGAAT